MCKLPILLLQLVLSGYVLSSKMHSLKVSRNRETSSNFKMHQERRSLQNRTGECYHSQDGSDYLGNVSMTVSGAACLNWIRYTPEEYPYGGIGEHNYCRNPDGDGSTWCFISEYDHDYCNIGRPTKNCETNLIVYYHVDCFEISLLAIGGSDFVGGHAEFWLFLYKDAPGPSNPLPRPHRVVKAVQSHGVRFATVFATKQCTNYRYFVIVYNADKSSSVKVTSSKWTDCGCEVASGKGDPHYKTFDGVRLTYNGNCTYLLAKDCYNKTATFEIFAKHGTVPETSARRIEEVIIKTRGRHKGHELTINRKNTVFIDGDVVTSDVHSDTGEAGMTYERSEEGVHYVWPQEGDWWMKYTSEHSTVTIECRYKSSLTGNTCGLLGNNNGNKTDDLMKADGSMAADFNELGDSYAVPKSCPP
ncbi:uncharacterized protein [Ptychodera flava]|uniref:uncharacterized protein n=1 Tax=Ptychodera flava TaxID=63121 RepID=UPI00396A5FCA